jgi:hypothetical protein
MQCCRSATLNARIMVLNWWCVVLCSQCLHDYLMCLLLLLLLPQSTRMSGSTDLNLLHYIVAHVSAVLPGALAVDGERQAFRAACRRGTFDAGEALDSWCKAARHNKLCGCRACCCTCTCHM